MSPTAQLGLVAVAIFAAVAYLVRRIQRRIAQSESRTGCGAGCGTCGQPASSAPNVIPLETLTSSVDTLKTSRK